jgi:hypothetical protein
MRSGKSEFRMVLLVAGVGMALALGALLSGCEAEVQPPAPSSELELALARHVHALAGPPMRGRAPGTSENRRARDLLVAAQRELGLDPPAGSYVHEVHPDLGDNVLGLRRGAQRPDEWVLVLAHYDHLGEHGGAVYPGADDNAAAAAVVIEAVRRLPPEGIGRSLLVVFPNTEEPPHFLSPTMGSEVLVRTLPPELGGTERIYAAVVLDLVGGAYWKPLEWTLFAAGAEKSPHVEAALAALDLPPGLRVLPIGLHLVEELPGHGRFPVSDYHPFRERGVPFLFLTAGRTPRYHTPDDRPETLHYARMALEARMLASLLEALGASDEPRGFEPEREAYRGDLDAIEPLVAAAASPGGAIPGTGPLSLLRLRQDGRALASVRQRLAAEAGLGRADIESMRRASFRLQCLLSGMSACFPL